MSRIHEAIKKLEQKTRELAAKTGSEDAVSLLESEVAQVLDASLDVDTASGIGDLDAPRPRAIALRIVG